MGRRGSMLPQSGAPVHGERCAGRRGVGISVPDQANCCEGVLYAKKDYNLAKHPQVNASNLEVIKLMQSFKSNEYVRETFSWQHYYWYLTNDGIEFLRTFLNLPSEIVPNTLKKSAKPPSRPFSSGPPGDRPRGPPRFEGERPRYGDRDGYRGGPRGAPGDFAGEKGGAPGDFHPSFRDVTMGIFLTCKYQVALSLLHLVSPMDILPEAVLGYRGLLDDILVFIAAHRAVLVARHAA